MSRFTNHTTSSSYLQAPTSSQLPPSSFRQSGGGLRNSLKKIPSSLFGEKPKSKDKEKMSIFMDDTSAIPRSFKSSAIPAFLSGNVSPPRADKTKLQKKTKTRKGLGEIFGWSSNNSNNANPPTNPPPIISAPSALLPSPPRFQRESAMPASIPMPKKEIIMPAKENIRPHQARRTSSKSSIPGLAGWAALRPPAETPAKARPSMAADPFGRTEVGAERVDQIQQCGELYERRGSVSSGKAFSSKTIDRSEQSKRASVGSGKALSSKTFGHDRLGSITSSKAISTKTVDSDYTIKYQGTAEIRRARHMSPTPARATLVELPSRANSTVRRPSVPIPSPRQLASIKVAKTVEKQEASPKAMKKEKTKSRVWGLLGIRSKKSKDLFAKTAAPVEPVSILAPVKQDKDTLTPSRVPKRVSSIHALQAQGSTKYSSRAAMHWPPSLHITQPSTDVQAGPATASTFDSFKQGDDFNPGTGDMAALMAHRSMPKRKSLNGLFGVSLREAEAFKARHQEPEEEAAPSIQASPLYISRFAEAPSIPRSNTLRRVASATDKLVDLVTAFEFSPVSRKTITPMESLSSIAETIKEAHQGSPTPMRKVKSGVLSVRGASPMRPGPNVSPLKLALHRKQLEAPSREVLRKKSSQNIFAPASPAPALPVRQDINATIRPSVQQNQVIKVTVSIETAARTESQPPAAAAATALPPPPRPTRRNIFAPPTPRVTAASLASLVQSDETVGKPQLRPISCGSAFTDRVEHDVPEDLRDLFVDADHILSATASPAHVAGLPQPPPSDRRPVAGRRRRNPPPAALPPSPPTPAHAVEHHQRTRGSAMSEFDFDSEFANLDQGDQRASFVEALHRAQGDHYGNHDLPPLPPLPGHLERDHEFSTDQFDDASERSSRSSTDTVVVAAAARRSPFMGTFAFQQHASTIKGSHSPPLADAVPEIQIQPEENEQVQEQEYSTFVNADANADAEDDTMELAPPPTRRNQRGHRRDESGLSIATMSSIGEVIETGIAGDYTNYFEAEFARDNAKRQEQPSTSGFNFDSTTLAHSRQSSVASNASRGHRRGHSRNTSIASITSIDGLDQSTLAGPPVSMHNRKRSTYISKHRQSGSSFESAFGRSDWAANHRRSQSDDSVMSNSSASRIARPGLGDRMFQLDGGVQLTSITGSPADGYDQDEQDEAEENEAILNMSKIPYYTAYDGEASFHTALDNSFGRDSETESSSSAKESDWNRRPVSTSSTNTASSRDSIFGPGPVNHKGSFLLRPISAITTDSSSNEEDTFVGVAKALQMKRAPSCIEAQGEETMTPVNIARPRKPRSDRRRHAQLALESDLETPGLTSPSTSEASSRMSLETRFSEGPPTRSFFAGHRRQQSSVVVQPQATIREEPSIDRLRDSPLEWKEVGIVRSYLDWEREADVECQKVKAQWEDSEESRIAVQEFKNQLPSSNQAIRDFLAQSSVAYGAIEQSRLPKAHRRKSSLSEARASLSPYGHPLARPPIHGGHIFTRPPVQVKVAEGQPQKKRVSLITKFERTNSAASSHFPSDVEPVSQPSSAIFAQFTRETPPTPPPSLMALPDMSPFKLNLSTGYSPVKKPIDTEKRSRVDSEVRRQALGWGKRRNSDGPAKVVAAEPPVPRIPLAFRPRTANQNHSDKENARPSGSPTKKATATKKPARRVPRLASVPKGLRA